MRRVLLLTTGTLPISLLLGALGVVLFDDVGWGLNLPVFALACYVVVLCAMRVRQCGGWREAAFAGALAVAWSSALVWRASPVLHGLAMLSLAGTLYFVYLRRESGSAVMPVSALFLSLPGLASTFLRGPVCALRQALGDARSGFAFNTVNSLAVARGIVLSVPLLVVFGWLLISADARFADFTWTLLTLDFASLARTLLTFAICFWIAIFLLRARAVRLGAERQLGKPGLQPLEITTALYVLNSLLVLYIAVQLTYFVGGSPLVRTAQSLTYAEYARRGFFELVAVAGLTVPLLLCADWLCESAVGYVRAAQQVATALTIALVTLVGASAAHRLLLYADAYGLTESRFYAAAVLLWATLLLAWIAWTVLRANRARFLYGAFAISLGVAGALLIANPDARIAAFNIKRAAAGQSLDTDYLLSLSDDAVPTILALRAVLAREHRITLDTELALRRFAHRPPRWQAWNWARHRAAHVRFTTAPAK